MMSALVKGFLWRKIFLRVKGQQLGAGLIRHRRDYRVAVNIKTTASFNKLGKFFPTISQLVR